jgi:hypothetical protein
VPFIYIGLTVFANSRNEIGFFEMYPSDVDVDLPPLGTAVHLYYVPNLFYLQSPSGNEIAGLCNSLEVLHQTTLNHFLLGLFQLKYKLLKCTTFDIINTA